jgi:hypothetical protein
MSFLNNLAALIAEHKGELVSVARTLLAHPETLGAVRFQLVALESLLRHEPLFLVGSFRQGHRNDKKEHSTFMRRVRQLWHPWEALPQYTMAIL